MPAIRFEDKVVAITGAGRGLGAAYARLLADRGARVVVNDLGTGMGGDGASEAEAAAVARDIVEHGGVAAANYGDVTDPAGAASIVEDALAHFGRLDAVINNAGIIIQDSFLGLTPQLIQRQFDVHVIGSLNVTQAAWPALVETRGAVLFTVSAGMLGSQHTIGYNIAKGGLLALTRSVAVEGREVGVRANAVMPGAETRMQGTALDAASEATAQRKDTSVHSPANAAQLACYLIHEDCPATGETYATGRGFMARMVLTSTGGVFEQNPTLEFVAERFEKIRALDGVREETDLAGHRARLLDVWS